MNLTEHSTKRSTIYTPLRHKWNSFQDRLHVMHKTALNKFKKTEIILRILSDHNELKLEINNRRKKLENL